MIELFVVQYPNSLFISNSKYVSKQLPSKFPSALLKNCLELLKNVSLYKVVSRYHEGMFPRVYQPHTPIWCTRSALSSLLSIATTTTFRIFVLDIIISYITITFLLVIEYPKKCISILLGFTRTYIDFFKEGSSMSKENVKVYEKTMMYTISYQNIQGYTFDNNTQC